MSEIVYVYKEQAKAVLAELLVPIADQRGAAYEELAESTIVDLLTIGIVRWTPKFRPVAKL